MPSPPDMPKNCAICVFHAPRDASSLLCRRHAPFPGKVENEVVSWPTVTPNQRCGEGSLGAPHPDGTPRQIIACECCVHWYSPEGGIPNDEPIVDAWWDDSTVHPHGPEWWAGAGLCLPRAPVPGVAADAEPTHWKVTHRTDGCGDGRDCRSEG